MGVTRERASRFSPGFRWNREIRVSRGDWLGKPANFKGPFCCFGFDVETYHHVTMTLHSLFQSKMADGADFLNGDDL